MNSAFGPMLSLSTPVNQYAPYFKEQKLLTIGWSIVFKKFSIFHDDSEFLLRKYPTSLAEKTAQKVEGNKTQKSRASSVPFGTCLLKTQFLKYDYIALLKRIRYAFIFSKSLYSCEPCSMFFRYASSFQNV